MSVLGLERIDLDVDHDVVLDALEVPLDVGGRADAEEEPLARLGALALEANDGEPALVEQPVRALGSEVEVVGAEGVSLRQEGFVSSRVVAVVVALRRVRPDEHAPAREQCERKKGHDAADDEECDPARAHAPKLLRFGNSVGDPPVTVRLRPRRAATSSR